MNRSSNNKVGILAGTFDPVHAGHITFAEQAIKQLALDKVVFLPERQPRGKKIVTELNDRSKMLELAVEGYENFEIYDTNELHFTLVKTLPKLRSKYPNSEFVFLVGSDVGHHLAEWSDIYQHADKVTFLVSVRSGHDETEIQNESPKLQLNFLKAPNPQLSSRQIREGRAKTGIAKVDHYIAEHHLYS